MPLTLIPAPRLHLSASVSPGASSTTSSTIGRISLPSPRSCSRVAVPISRGPRRVENANPSSSFPCASISHRRDYQGIVCEQQKESIAPGVMASHATAALEVQEDPAITASKDLLIIGPGVLGKLVAGLWMKEFPGCSVVGQTVTTNHHGELQSLGIQPLLKGNQSEKGFPFVVFCAPPSQSSDYAGELRLAAEQWNGEGVLLFTSSSAVYDCADNGECDEDTPIVNLGRSPRTDVLLRAEQEVLQVGGTVVRLAGLYTKERGPHAYWAKKGIVDARPDHILNLIHYEDAASLCLTILKKGFRNEVFMGCDNHPLSRQEVMNIVNESGKFDDKFEAFTGVDGPLGKKMNCDRTRSKTGWQPKYKSFAEFIHLVA